MSKYAVHSKYQKITRLKNKYLERIKRLRNKRIVARAIAKYRVNKDYEVKMEADEQIEIEEKMDVDEQIEIDEKMDVENQECIQDNDVLIIDLKVMFSKLRFSNSQNHYHIVMRFCCVKKF